MAKAFVSLLEAGATSLSEKPIDSPFVSFVPEAAMGDRKEVNFAIADAHAYRIFC